MSKLAKIIRMEFRLTVANQVFIVLTILGPFLIAAVTILPGLLSTSVEAMGARHENRAARRRSALRPGNFSRLPAVQDRGQRGSGVRRIARLPGPCRGI